LRAGIMQPYYFPYAGYISLLKHVDIFVLFDVVQFIHHGWIERNRILKPKEGWQYIQVPLVKHSRETKILDIKIRNTENWQERTFAQLVHYKKRAPHYAHVIELLKELYSHDYEDITSLNKAASKLFAVTWASILRSSFSVNPTYNMKRLKLPDCGHLIFVRAWRGLMNIGTFPEELNILIGMHMRTMASSSNSIR